MHTLGILLKKEFDEAFSAFNGRKKSVDVAGGVLSFLLLVGITAFVCFILDGFADMYTAIEINRVSDRVARLNEMFAVIYGIILLVNALSGIRVINSSLFENEDMRIFITLPVKPVVMYASKMIVAYVKQFAVGVVTVLPVNITLALQADMGAGYWGLSVLILFLLPMISLAIGSVFALPWHYVKRAVSSRYAVTLIVVTAVTGVVFWGYSVVLGFVAELVSTGNVKYFFNAEVMMKIGEVTSNLYPAVFFADMLTGKSFPAAVGYTLLITAVLTAIGLAFGRWLLLPAAQDRFTAVNRRILPSSQKLPAPRNSFLTLIKKEFLLVLRTPDYAFRYFSTAVVMPLMVYFCTDIFSALVGTMVFVDCNLEIAIFLIVMFGILTNTFCATNISRDGEFFFIMKTMPLDYRKVISAKVVFCFVVSFVSVSTSVAVIGGTGFITQLQSLYVWAVTVAVSFAQICFATRKDFNHPRFNKEGDGEVRESNTTVSVLILIGLAVSFLIGFIALYSGMYLKLQRGEAYGELVSMTSVAAIAVVLVVASVFYLVKGLDKKYYELSEANL